MHRLFLSIDLPEEIRDTIADLYCAINGARWTDENQLHLTLRFIDNVDNECNDKIIKALDMVSFDSFTLTLKGIGFFPPRKEPRVVWIGIENSEELLRLQSRIERELVAIGIVPDERKFHPHITIARLSQKSEIKIGEFIALNSLFKVGPFHVNEYILYESFLKREGADHVKQVVFPLNDTLL